MKSTRPSYPPYLELIHVMSEANPFLMPSGQWLIVKQLSPTTRHKTYQKSNCAHHLAVLQFHLSIKLVSDAQNAQTCISMPPHPTSTSKIMKTMKVKSQGLLLLHSHDRAHYTFYFPSSPLNSFHLISSRFTYILLHSVSLYAYFPTTAAHLHTRTLWPPPQRAHIRRQDDLSMFQLRTWINPQSVHGSTLFSTCSTFASTYVVVGVAGRVELGEVLL